MKVQLVKKEKLDRANENIAWLIGNIIENEMEMNEGYCPYRMPPSEKEKICNQFSECCECEVAFYAKRKRELLEEYSVKG